jgi:hypothetical protein
MKRTVRAAHRISTDEFTISYNDLTVIALTREQARQIVLDLVELINEPIVLPPPPSPETRE